MGVGLLDRNTGPRDDGRIIVGIATRRLWGNLRPSGFGNEVKQADVNKVVSSAGKATPAFGTGYRLRRTGPQRRAARTATVGSIDVPLQDGSVEMPNPRLRDDRRLHYPGIHAHPVAGQIHRRTVRNAAACSAARSSPALCARANLIARFWHPSAGVICDEGGLATYGSALRTQPDAQRNSFMSVEERLKVEDLAIAIPVAQHHLTLTKHAAALRP